MWNTSTMARYCSPWKTVAHADPAQEPADEQIVEERIDEHLAEAEQAGRSRESDDTFPEST